MAPERSPASPASTRPSLLLTGDPVLLTGVRSLDELLARIDLPREGVVGAIPLDGASRAIFHWSTREAHLELRWLPLVDGPRWGDEAAPLELAVVACAPLAESASALHAVARLRACMRGSGLREQSLRARSRADLVNLLLPLEASAGESVLSEAEVLAALASSPSGLTAAESARRALLAGPNRLDPPDRRPLGLQLLAQFSSFFALLLWIGGFAAILARMPQLGWAIFAVIVINGVFSFFQEYRAERALEALARLLPHTVRVRRGREEPLVDATSLVPGDVIVLEEGEQVPADGCVLTAMGLRVDQSLLTGESHPVLKRPPDPHDREHVPHLEKAEQLFAGTAVVGGAGRAVVTGIGMGTEMGHLAHLTQAVQEEESPLQREMRGVTHTVTALALSFGLLLFLLGAGTGLLPVSQGLVFALGVIVANVPEGLLPTLTLALSLGAQQLARERSLVKRLSAVEALGATTVVCTDKTGTLTENRMSIRYLWADGRVLERSLEEEGTGPQRLLLERAVLASRATLDHGDPMEVALVRAAAELGADPLRLREDAPILADYSFDSFRKRMTLVRSWKGTVTAFVKGAPRETLRLCERVRAGEGESPLVAEQREAILAEHDRLAEQGHRMLAVATRGLSEVPADASPGGVERALTFEGFVALWDPPRPEVPEAMRLCSRAGIRVVMVTGDYGLTAQAVARAVGLPARKVVSGGELDRLPPPALERLVREPGVLFARTSPAHKLAIVNALRANGQIVAVTGDGVNDAPALKAADIGVAMGKRGSDVAREAADMVITDDNFASIVSAIRLGRAIYANMGKFTTYIFASNVPELVPFLAFVFLGIPLPLTVMQILAVDLGTDLLPALALGAEAPEPDVMDRPPRSRRERLLDRGRLLRAYAFLGAIEAALAMGAFFWTYWRAGWRPGLPMDGRGELYARATTMTFVAIVAAQVGNVFCCRTERASVFRAGLFENRRVLYAIAAELMLLGTLIGFGPLRRAFDLSPPQAGDLAPVAIFPLLILAFEEGRKAIVRKWEWGGAKGAAPGNQGGAHA